MVYPDNGGMSCLYSIVLIESYTVCVRTNAHPEERPIESAF